MKDYDKILDTLKENIDGPSHKVDKNFHPNSISSTILNMTINHKIFSTINEVGMEVLNAKEQDYYVANNHLSNLIYQGYYYYQCSIIRKLIEQDSLEDKKSEVYSLRKLIDQLEYNFTETARKEFVCRKNIPYEYKDEYNAALYAHRGMSGWVSIPENIKSSKELHKQFDSIIKQNPGKERSPEDKISRKYFTNLRKKLETTEMNKIRITSNKYLFHMASQDSIDLKDDRFLELCRADIIKCHNAIIDIFQKILYDFWGTSMSFSDLVSRSEIIKNMDKPFAPIINLR